MPGNHPNYVDRESAFWASLKLNGEDYPDDAVTDSPIFMMPYDREAYEWAERDSRTIDFGGKPYFKPADPGLAPIPPRRPPNVSVGDVRIHPKVSAEIGPVQIHDNPYMTHDPVYMDALLRMIESRHNPRVNAEVGPVTIQRRDPEPPVGSRFPTYR